ncbi:hypothetical protein M8332_02220 [Fructilactobacillus ixorae]|uniref:Uncharacterized protein n=1 Tax=Fructilactobacillus ixorae TaxID=1750535 RepID=A0ABY5C783_9LACO|nr:hypothetical protein [Fructilactobacillus ixorae]USS93688.1 hypothetical protein M8332_02220 [Fructilactobacillus ixorae]
METRVKKQHRKTLKKFLLGLLFVIPVAFLVGYEIAQSGYHNDKTGKIIDVATGQEATEAEKNEFMQNQEAQLDYLKRANEKIN